jgi:replicative DNA helicase
MPMTSFVDANGISNFAERAYPLERTIIATLLDSPSLFTKVAEVIEPGDFFNDGARQIYAWVSGETKLNNPVSAALALSRFASMKFVEEFLMESLAEMPDALSVTRAAEELRNIAVRRDTLRNLQQVQVDLLQFKAPLSEDLSKLSKGVQDANHRMTSGADTVKSYADVFDRWFVQFTDLASGKTTPGVPTGFDQLDEFLAGLQPADLIIIGGRPSMGKTTFAMNIIEYVSVVLNRATMVFSLEMPDTSILQRSVASIGGIDFEDLRRGKLKVGDLEKLQIASEKLKKAPIFIDDSPGLTLQQLCARAIRKFDETPFSLIMIDYLQLMRLSALHAGDPVKGLGEITQGLKALGKLLGIPIIVLSQLSRSLEQRPNKRPIAADLRESGAIEQDADVIMFVYRDEVYNPDTEYKGIAEIIIGKQRNGPLGTAYVGFTGGQSRFKNIDQSLVKHPDPQTSKRGGKDKARGDKGPSSAGEVLEGIDFRELPQDTMPWEDPASDTALSDPDYSDNPL